MLCNCIVFAQPNAACSTVTFQKEIIISDTENYRERILSAIATQDSSIIFTGREQYNGSGILDSNFITKLSAQGNFIWSKKFKTYSSLSNKIFELKDKSLLMLEPSNQYDNFSISKLNSNGSLLWRKEFSELQYYITSIEDLIETDDGHILGTGYGDFNGSLLCKFDSDGNLLWSKSYLVPPTFGGGLTFGTNFIYKSLAETADGYIFINTYHLTSWSQQTPIYVFKVEKTTGALLWSKQIKLTDNRFILPSMVKRNNNLYFISHFASTQNNPGLRHIAVIKTDLNGNIVNAVKIPSIKRYNYIVTEEEKILFTLSDTLYQSTGKPFSMFQIDSNLNFEWAKRYEIEVDSTSSVQYRPLTVQNKDQGIVSFFLRRNNTMNSTFTYFIKTDKSGSSGECLNENIPIAVSPLQLTTESFASNVEDRSYSFINQMIPMIDRTISINEICYQTSRCDSIKLSGTSMLCNLTDSINYKISRNAGCFSTAIWNLSDTSYGNMVVNSDTSIKIKFIKTGQVYLYATIPGSCGDIKDSLLITIYRPADNLNLGNDFSICGTNSFTLNAGNGYANYLWQDGSSSSDFTGNVSGIYHVTVTDYCNNSFTDSVIINEALPETIELGNDVFICRNDSITINGPAGFAKYQWAPNQHILSTVNQNATVYPTTATKYFLYAEKIAGSGCISVDSIWVNIHPVNTIKLRADTSICFGDAVTLDAGAGFTQYIWSSGQNSSQISVTQTGMYIVNAVDVNNCKVKDTFQLLNVFANPVVKLGSEDFLCSTTTKLLVAGNAANQQYLWQDGSTASTYLASDTGLYKVTVTNTITTCSSKDSIHIKTLIASPSNFLPKDTSVCPATPITIVAIPGFNKYTWSTGSSSQAITVSQPGLYRLQVADAFNCLGSDSITVSLKICTKSFYIPSAFTPNGDGLNDVFKPSVSVLPQNYTMNIFNRYGELIFKSNDPAKGWNGTYKAAFQNTGAYSWVIQYQFTGEPMQQVKGSVLLIR